MVELQKGPSSPQAEALKEERGQLMRELREKVTMGPLKSLCYNFVLAHHIGIASSTIGSFLGP